MDEEALLDLVTGGERELRRAYAEVIAYLREQNQLSELEQLIARGHVDDVIQHLDRAAGKIVERIEAVYVRAALETARVVTAAGTMITFQATNPQAVAALEQLRLDRIRGFTDEQIMLTRQVLVRGLERGDNPRKMARELRSSIGLTPAQEQVVANYRAQLERGQWTEASRRELHDGRYDRTLNALRRRQESLTPQQVDTMVERYRSNWIAHRAETIARTEALSAVHMGSDQAFLQAIDRRELQAEQLECIWHSGSIPRTRDWHASMNQQRRPWRVPFTSGQGTSILYPGQADLPASERVNCRCARSVRVKQLKNGRKR